MKKKYQVKFTHNAEQHIREIWDYIAQDSKIQAERFILESEEHIDRLEFFPERCSLIPEHELLMQEYRHLIHGKYRVIFQVTDDSVIIKGIIHGARQLEKAAYNLFDSIVF